MNDKVDELREEAVELAAEEAPGEDRSGAPARVWLPLTALTLLAIAVLFAYPAIVS